MGRLTLNVLLSFAQFEREVTSERIRDKIAASKRRGLWVGGMVPLGYESRDKKLVINEEEAERVRLIFRRYLELASLGKLMEELRERGIVSKGAASVEWAHHRRDPLHTRLPRYLLRNRFYIGEVRYRGESVSPSIPRSLIVTCSKGCSRRFPPSIAVRAAERTIRCPADGQAL